MMIRNTIFNKIMATIFIPVFIYTFLFCCQEKKKYHQSEIKLELPLGLDSTAINIPKDNPLTKAKIDLGRKLYFDERLSLDGTISCTFCHNPLLGCSDGRYKAMGILGKSGIRNTSTLLNRVFGKEHFLDGRAKSIEDVILEHIQNPDEFNNSPDNLEKTLSKVKDYQERFEQAFGTGVTVEGITKAIASYVRTLVTGNSRYDKYIAGDNNALSESAKRGLELFKSDRLKCSKCHCGHNLTDEKFHNNGTGMDKENPDLGRYNVTGIDSDKGKFKTPTLRDIPRSSPYMHDGSLKSLMYVIEYYDAGCIPNKNLSDEFKPLHLTKTEKNDLLEFLRSLTGGNILFTGNQF